jgi:hypothetical protein
MGMNPKEDPVGFIVFMFMVSAALIGFIALSWILL